MNTRANRAACWTRLLVGFLSVPWCGCGEYARSVFEKQPSQGGGEGIAYHLPQAVIVLDVDLTGPLGGPVAISVVPSRELQPDPNARYWLRQEHSAFAHDTLGLTLTSDGLLSSAGSTASDKSGEIAQTLIATGVQLAKAAAAFRIAVQDGTDPAELINKHLRQRGKMRYLVEGDWELLRTEGTCTLVEVLERLGARGTMEPAGVVYIETRATMPEGTMPDTREGKSRPDPPPRVPGLAYRPAMGISVSCRLMYSKELGSWAPKNPTPAEMHALEGNKLTPMGSISAIVTIPDPRVVGQLPLDREPLVTVTRNYTFDRGMLIGVESDTPSSALAAALLLYKAAEGLAALPKGILTAKVEVAEESKKLEETGLAIERARLALETLKATGSQELRVAVLELEKRILELQEQIRKIQEAKEEGKIQGTKEEKKKIQGAKEEEK